MVVSAPTVTAALAKANRLSEAVQKSLLANGVVKKDLQTSGLTISPRYKYSKTGSPSLNGYSVSESVNAKLRNLVTAGDAIGKAITTGGNAVRVNGISLDLEETGAWCQRHVTRRSPTRRPRLSSTPRFRAVLWAPS